VALQLASLTKDGAVSFASAGDLDAAWTTYIAKGALPVKPERALAPLEQLEIYVLCPGLAVPVALRVEVVHLEPNTRALLRLLEPPPPKPSLKPPEPERPAENLAPLEIIVDKAPSARAIVVDTARDAPTPEAPAPSTTREVVVGAAPPPTPPEQPLALAGGGALVIEIAPEPKPQRRSTDRASRTGELDITAMPAPDAPTRAATPLPRTGTPMPVRIAPLPEIALEPLLTPANAAPKASAPAPVAPVAATMPPFFSVDALRFQSMADYQAARPHLESVGAVLAVADGTLPTKAVDVVIAVGARFSSTKVKVTLSAAAPGTAVVQAVEKRGFAPLLAELDAPPPASATQSVPAVSKEPTTGSFPAVPSRAFTLARQGTVANPTTAAGILALPMARPPSEAELAAPSMPLLLRWLRTTRGSLRLEVTAPDHPVFTAVFVDGREVRTPASLTGLGKSFALPKMTYSVIDLGRPPTLTTTGRTLHLIAETIRGLCQQIEVEELSRAFPRRENRCPRAVSDIAAGLGLPQQHMRFIKTDVDGNQFLDEIARAAVGGRVVWETMVLLELFNALTWDEAPEGKKQGRTGPIATPSERTGNFSTDALDAAWLPFEGKDHFGVLGLHWSSSPTEVAPAFQKLKSEYGPNGMKRPSDAKVAERIVKRLEEAYKVLNETNARRAYRREKYNLVWAHQAQLLVQKAKLAIYRKDIQEAMNALLAAEDMASTDEARAMLASIKQKLGGGDKS
jgi:hypothetical protein